MATLLLYIRPFVLVFSLLLSLGIYVYSVFVIPEGSAQIAHLVRACALTALTYLYTALLISPLYTVFPMLPLRGLFIKARRAIGVSAFYFAFLHASIAFFMQLGGFEGLTFLPMSYLTPIIFGASSLFILFLMALTSNDKMIAFLTFPRWKFLHRFVYLVAIFTVIHALMIGTHFRNLGNWISQTFFIAGIFLLLLESIRFDFFLKRRFPLLGIGPTFMVTTTLVVGFFVLSFFSKNGSIPSLGVHSQHVQIAKDLQQTTSNIPSLKGDRTKRYTVSFLHDEWIFPEQETLLNFKVFDASSGKETTAFTKISEKLAHLIVANESFSYFTHIHPDQNGNEFSIETSFPQDGTYHLYLDFQPFGAIEQQIGFTLKVGETSVQEVTPSREPTFLSKSGNYEITLKRDQFLSSAMSVGEQLISFTIKDDETKNPITTLKPYLGSFGHLVLINQDSFDYVHVHAVIPAKSPTDTGGPTVEFLPLGLYGPIKPGAYRAYAQFNPNDNLILGEFTIKVE